MQFCPPHSPTSMHVNLLKKYEGNLRNENKTCKCVTKSKFVGRLGYRSRYFQGTCGKEYILENLHWYNLCGILFISTNMYQLSQSLIPICLPKTMGMAFTETFHVKVLNFGVFSNIPLVRSSWYEVSSETLLDKIGWIFKFASNSKNNSQNMLFNGINISWE